MARKHRAVACGPHGPPPPWPPAASEPAAVPGGHLAGEACLRRSRSRSPSTSPPAGPSPLLSRQASLPARSLQTVPEGAPVGGLRRPRSHACLAAATSLEGDLMEAGRRARSLSEAPAAVAGRVPTLARLVRRRAGPAVRDALQERTSLWVVALVAVDLGLSAWLRPPGPSPAEAALRLGLGAVTLVVPRAFALPWVQRLRPPAVLPHVLVALPRLRLMVREPCGSAVALACLWALRPVVARLQHGDGPPDPWRLQLAAALQAGAMVGGRRTWRAFGPAALRR